MLMHSSASCSCSLSAYSRARPVNRTAAVAVASRKWGRKRQSAPSQASQTPGPAPEDPQGQVHKANHPLLPEDAVPAKDTYKAVAKAVQVAFLEHGIKGGCIPASVAFCEAVVALDIGADVQLRLCWEFVPHPELATYHRHMVVHVDGEVFDIGGSISNENEIRELGEPLSSSIVYDLPEGVPPETCFGWRMSTDPERSTTPKGKESAICRPSDEADAYLLGYLSSAEGRQACWEGKPPEVEEARQRSCTLPRS